MGKVDIKKVYNGGERLNRKRTIKKVMFMRKKKVREKTDNREGCNKDVA